MHVTRQRERERERENNLDLLRIVDTFCVIVLHCAASQWSAVSVNSFEWGVFNFYDSVVRFCVPVFVMISGVFFLDEEKEYSIRKLYSHNILRIVSAFVFWSLFYATIVTFVIPHESNCTNKILLFCGRFILGHYHLWFLYLIVGLYIIVPFLRKIVSPDPNLIRYFLLLSVLFSSIIPSITNFMPLVYQEQITKILAKLNLHLVLGYSGYFILGYYLFHLKIKKNTRITIYFLGILSIFATVLLTSIFSQKNNSPIQTFYSYLYPTTVISSSAIFVFFTHLNKTGFIKKLESYIQIVAPCTFGIYLVHDFFNIVLIKIGIITTSFCPVISVPLLSIIVFILSFLAILIIRKNKIFSGFIS